RPRITSDLVREPSSQLKNAPIDAPNNVSNDVPISAHSEAYSDSHAPTDAPGGSDSPSPAPAPELDLPICKSSIGMMVNGTGERLLEKPRSLLLSPLFNESRNSRNKACIYSLVLAKALP
ncbi:hypothetical protein Tco_1333159, partial [Tanacetum coccineum]